MIWCIFMWLSLKQGTGNRGIGEWANGRMGTENEEPENGERGIFNMRNP